MSIVWRPHDDELISADAMRAAFRLGQRFVFREETDPDAWAVCDVLTCEDYWDTVDELELLGQASRSEVCGFLSWLVPSWTDRGSGQGYTTNDSATFIEFFADDAHGFDIEWATVYVQQTALGVLRNHAYALANLVKVGEGK